MLRRILLATSLVAVTAAIAPAHALNPQPLPPSPCKCDFSKFSNFKINYYKFYLQRNYFKYRYANVR